MQKIDPINVDDGFVLRILALLLRSDWLTKYGPILQKEHLPSKHEQQIVAWTNKYWEKYRQIPSETDISHALKDNPLVHVLYELEDEQLEYVSDTVLDFIRTQAMKIAILESTEDIASGDLHMPIQRVQDALKIGTDLSRLGRDLVDDADDWIYDELHGKKFPTGWSQIDRCLDGGVVAGEYWMVMAPPNMGKSMMLVNIGYAMAGLLGIANVCHMTFEMAESKVLKRYGARLTGVRLSRSEFGSASEVAYKQQILARARQRLRGRLRVVAPANNWEDVRRTLDLLDTEGFHTDALIIDYPDLINPIRKRTERRFELADNAREAKQIGKDYGVPVWGATQAGRQAFRKEIITQADIAEAIEKAAVADGILALCQTSEEERLQQARIFGAKSRDSESKFLVPVKLDFKTQSIVQRLV